MMLKHWKTLKLVGRLILTHNNFTLLKGNKAHSSHDLT